jgi:hypothetical protein
VTIKDFLRPTKWKIALFLLIFVLVPWPLYGPCQGGGNCLTMTGLPLLSAFWSIYLAAFFITDIYLVAIPLVALIVSYIISAVIVIFVKRGKQP